MTTEQAPREVDTACHCPDSPHERDHFVLPADLPITAGLAAVTGLAQVGEHGDAAAALINAILVNGGIASWNLVDDKGDALPINPTNVATRITWTKGGVELASAAYAQWVNGKDLAPFGLRQSANRTAGSSRNGQTVRSTSRKPRSSATLPAPTE
jgi:hypothetical protein